MHAPTAPSPESHYNHPDRAQYPVPADPWAENNTSVFPYVPLEQPLTEQEHARFNEIIANYHDTSAPETQVRYRVHGEAPPEPNLATPEQQAEIKRRSQQALLATFTLASTLERNGEPERMQELQRATAPPVGRAAAIPPHPSNYQGRHRRRSWWRLGSK